VLKDASCIDDAGTAEHAPTEETAVASKCMVYPSATEIVSNNSNDGSDDEDEDNLDNEDMVHHESNLDSGSDEEIIEDGDGSDANLYSDVED
ncbi:hypothetical protein DXG01_009682, partial [Tephrocybe rancida]